MGREAGDYHVIALAGNPNTGKSTVFNALTGLKQHTGNWPGKTVLLAEGSFIHHGARYKLVDLPGTYSLIANSGEEEVARDFIYFGNPDATVVVTDATCLERNLNLVYQIMEITPRVVMCVNLMDEARRKRIKVNKKVLAKRLGIPVVTTIAKSGEGLYELKEIISRMATGRMKTQPCLVKYEPEVEAMIECVTDDLRKVIGKDYCLRWLALRVLDGDSELIKRVEERVSGRNCKHGQGRLKQLSRRDAT